MRRIARHYGRALARASDSERRDIIRRATAHAARIAGDRGWVVRQFHQIMTAYEISGKGA